MTQMLALFKEEEAAASATEALQHAGHGNETFDILTGSPYPEGAFGEQEPKHRLYVFPLMGAIAGFSVGPSPHDGHSGCLPPGGGRQAHTLHTGNAHTHV